MTDKELVEETIQLKEKIKNHPFLTQMDDFVLKFWEWREYCEGKKGGKEFMDQSPQCKELFQEIQKIILRRRINAHKALETGELVETQQQHNEWLKAYLREFLDEELPRLNNIKEKFRQVIEAFEQHKSETGKSK